MMKEICQNHMEQGWVRWFQNGDVLLGQELSDTQAIVSRCIVKMC